MAVNRPVAKQSTYEGELCYVSAANVEVKFSRSENGLFAKRAIITAAGFDLGQQRPALSYDQRLVPQPSKAVSGCGQHDEERPYAE